MQDQDGNSEEPNRDAREQDGIGDASSDVSTQELRRRGELEKCPVCGSHVDAEAYHCPKCRNYFCFHCRARLLSRDTQLQCTNGQCNYYGKLVCEICDVVGEKEESPAVYVEPEDGYWPVWLLLVLIVAAVTWYYTSLLVAAGTAIAAYVGGGFLLHRVGMNVFGRERTVEHPRKSSFHTCISCQLPVKELHAS